MLCLLAGIGVGMLAADRWLSINSEPNSTESATAAREDIGAVIAITMENTEWKDFHDRFGPCWLVARSQEQPPMLLPIDREGNIRDEPPPGSWRLTFACDGLLAEDHQPWELWSNNGPGDQPSPLDLEFPSLEPKIVRLKLPALAEVGFEEFKTREIFHLGFQPKTPETIQSLLTLPGLPLLPKTVECGQFLAIRSFTRHEESTSGASLVFRLEEKQTPGIQTISEAFMDKLMADRGLPESEKTGIAAVESIADMVGFFQPRLSRAKNRAGYMFWKSLQELKWLSLNSNPIPPKVSPLRVHLLADTGRYLYRLPNSSGSDDFLWQDRRGARFSAREAGDRESLLLSPPGFDIILLAGQPASTLSGIESLPAQPSN